jgi:hypothetical protein
MVIWKGVQDWNAFGFFGKGGSGKTTVSFDFALRLLRAGIVDLKVFDDRFLFMDGLVRRDEESKWGSDRLDKRAEFEQEAKLRNKQLDDFLPEIGKDYVIVNNATIWFLCAQDALSYYRKSLSFEEFLNLLASSDPCHEPKNLTEIDLMHSFRQNWNYEQVWLPKPLDILEAVAEAAYETHQQNSP